MAKYLDTWERDKRSGKLGVLDKIKLALMPEDKTLIGSLDPTTLARGVDWSHWQGDVDFARFVAEGDVAAGMPKCSDGKQVVSGDPSDFSTYVDDWFYRNVQKIYDAKRVCGPFHYVQPMFPNYTVAGMIEHNWKAIKKAMDPLAPKKSYHFFVLDVEEKTTTDYNGSDVVLGLRDRCLNDAKLGQVPIVIYTSMSILNYYTKLREQISFPNYTGSLLWMAQWPYNTVTTTTWANMIASILAKLSIKVLTPGYADWWALQWTSSLILPGCAGRLDQNVFKMTKAQLFTQLGFDPGTTPPPPDPDPDPEPPPADLTAVWAEIDAIKARMLKLEGHTHGGPLL